MRWESEQAFFQSQSFFDSAIQAIGSAKRSVDLEIYIFTVNKVGQRVVDALCDAAARGVAVRLLVDGIGTLNCAYDLLKLLPPKGVQVRIFHPAPWPMARFFSLEAFRLVRTFQLFAHVNRRNHKKVILVDGREAFVGSMNVTDEVLDWRETGVRVTGQETEKLVRAFAVNWKKSYSPDRGAGPHKPQRVVARKVSQRLLSNMVRLNFPRSLRKRNNRLFLRELRAGRQRIWITNPYFVPSVRLVAVLIHCVRRGVDVRVLLPAKIDHVFMKWVNRIAAVRLVRSGVQVFEYLPRVLHAKTTLIDQKALIGSSNLNQRSLRHDLEVDILISGKEAVTAVERQFLKDLRDAQPITDEILSNSSWTERWLGRLLMIFFKKWM